MNVNLQRSVLRLSMRHLRIVLAIADHGSLVAAAKQLQMTQPAVSKALQETEALLGVEMFARTNRGVVPTAFGETLAAHGRLIFAQLDHANHVINDLRDGLGGRVVIGTLLAASADLLPKAIAKLRRERPKIAISVVVGTDDRLLPDLRLGKLDLVVGRLDEHGSPDGLSQETLIMDAACVVVGSAHPLVGRANLGLADLLDENWILPGPETSLRGQIEAAFRVANVEPPANAVDSVSQLTNRHLVINEGYITVWPWLLAHDEVQAGNVAILPFDLDATTGPIGISTRAGEQLYPAVEMCVQALREAAATIQTHPFLTGMQEGNDRLSETQL
jgi:DNA-binding transcriptional LysR family regulator